MVIVKKHMMKGDFFRICTFALVTLLTACGGSSSSDETGDSSEPIASNTSPVADAGDDRFAIVSSIISLDGNDSSDLDGDVLSYRWQIDVLPDSSSAALDDDTSATPVFTVDIIGQYIISLTVNDGESDSEKISISISVTDDELTAYTLFAPMGSTDTLLINEQGETMHSWQSEYRPGLSVYLLENGELLRTGAINAIPDTFAGGVGGSAGIIEILDWDSNLVWSQTLATESYFSHHDIEQLPHGHILVIVWEAKTAGEAMALGRTSVSGDSLWGDAVYEICRASSENDCIDGELVWSWSVWDHVIQDVDSSIVATYVTDISEHTDKVNLNYVSGQGSSDWLHINAVDYNANEDLIVLSVHNFSEYWIISHGENNSGILARAGNPAAYNASGEQTLFVQHDVQWIAEGYPGAGNILVFNNGANRPDGDYSSVDEYCDNDNCQQGELQSSYSEGVNGSFYASRISGAQRLANGNTLVCEGTEGRFFEYNASHEIVWDYTYGQSVFRAYRYYSDYNGLAKLML